MIIAAYNPKGGVGKTTTAVNIAAALARSGQSVLLVDLEADANASISLGVSTTGVATMADVLVHDVRAHDAVRAVTGFDKLHLIPGSRGLAHIDDRLRNVRQPERRLADVIRPLLPEFDIIVLDAPAGYSLLSSSVAMAAQHLIVPIRAEYLSLESLAQFLRWFRDRHESRRAIAQVAGILLTMVDYRRQATREIVDMIRRHNRRGVFRTEIPQDQRVPEAPSHGLPLGVYAPGCRAADAYDRLTAELMKRLHVRA